MMRLFSRLLHRVLAGNGTAPSPTARNGVFVSGYACRACTVCVVAAGASWLAFGDNPVMRGALFVLALVLVEDVLRILLEGAAGLWDRFQAWRYRPPV